MNEPIALDYSDPEAYSEPLVYSRRASSSVSSSVSAEVAAIDQELVNIKANNTFRYLAHANALI